MHLWTSKTRAHQGLTDPLWKTGILGLFGGREGRGNLTSSWRIGLQIHLVALACCFMTCTLHLRCQDLSKRWADCRNVSARFRVRGCKLLLPQDDPCVPPAFFFSLPL